MKDVQTTKGASALIFAALVYGSFGSLTRLIGLDFGAFAQNAFRNVFVVLMVLSYFLFAGKRFSKFRKKDIKWIISWGLIGSINMILLFISFNNLAIGTTYFLFYTGLISSGLMTGKLLFNEKMTFKKFLSLFLLLAGLLLIYSLDITSDTSIFLVFAVIAGITVGIWNTINKKFSENYDEFQLVFVDSSFGVMVSFLGLLLFGQSIPTFAVNIRWLGVFLNAVGQFATTFLIIYGFKRLEAQIGTIILPLEIVFGAAFGFIFFREILSFSTITGGVLILIASILPYLPRKYIPNIV
jgi:drug/metabolite transporter (DMT)-like permease